MELYADIMSINSYFIVKLKDKSYIDERYTIKENDSEIKIKLTKDRIKKFHNPSLKEEYGKEEHLNLRILTIELDNGKTETLLTNIFNKEFQIEDFSGIRRPIIEQDFYAHIFIYNLAITIKNHAENNITRTPRNKDKKIIYQSNFAKITGNIYLFFFDILFESRTKREEIIDFIIKEASKELTQYKENQYENKERKAPDVNNKHPGNKKKNTLIQN